MFHDPVLAKARARLDEVFKMREAQAELAKLLTDEEAKSLTLSEVFRPFAGVDPAGEQIHRTSVGGCVQRLRSAHASHRGSYVAEKCANISARASSPPSQRR